MEEEKNTQQETVQNEPVTVSDEELKIPEDSVSSMSIQEDKTAHLGAILGILIVVLILILGGLYIWGTMMAKDVVDGSYQNPAAERPTAEENNEPESDEAEAEVETMGALSTSDEIEAIEADLESTNLDELDAELNAIDAELEAALQGL